MSIEIVPFIQDHLDAAAKLLAARHAANCRLEPLLPKRFEDPGECRLQLEALLPKGCGVAAFRDGRLIGYLLTRDSPPHEPQRRSLVLLEGHAIAIDESPVAYRHMYAALAPMLIVRGIFDHQVLVPTANRATMDAWYSLTFGQWVHVAARGLGPLPAIGSDIQIQQVGPDRLERIMNLFFALGRYDTGPPMFAPYLVNEEGWRSEVTGMLGEPDTAFFLALQGGVDVGVLSLGRPRDEAAHGPQGRAHIWEAFVFAEARRRGVGTELLRHAIDWARENTCEILTLEFRSANLIGAPFWQSHGFRPFATILQRRIDERIAWAHGRQSDTDLWRRW